MIVFFFEIPIMVIIFILLAVVGGAVSILNNLAGIGMYFCATLYIFLAVLIAVAVWVAHSDTSEGLLPKVRGALLAAFSFVFTAASLYLSFLGSQFIQTTSKGVAMRNYEGGYDSVTFTNHYQGLSAFLDAGLNAILVIAPIMAIGLLGYYIGKKVKIGAPLEISMAALSVIVAICGSLWIANDSRVNYHDYIVNSEKTDVATTVIDQDVLLSAEVQLNFDPGYYGATSDLLPAPFSLSAGSSVTVTDQTRLWHNIDHVLVYNDEVAGFVEESLVSA